MQDIVYKLVPGLQEGECQSTTRMHRVAEGGAATHSCCLSSCRAAAEIKKQRDFYQKLGMEVPGDIKGELNNMKTHLDQRNGMFRFLQPRSGCRDRGRRLKGHWFLYSTDDPTPVLAPPFEVTLLSQPLEHEGSQKNFVQGQSEP